MESYNLISSLTMRRFGSQKTIHLQKNFRLLQESYSPIKNVVLYE
jgi:hypothetical protein